MKRWIASLLISIVMINGIVSYIVYATNVSYDKTEYLNTAESTESVGSIKSKIKTEEKKKNREKEETSIIPDEKIIDEKSIENEELDSLIESIKKEGLSKAEEKEKIRDFLKEFREKSPDPRYEFPEKPSEFDLSDKDFSSVDSIEITVDYSNLSATITDKETINRITQYIGSISCYDTGLISAYYSGAKYRVVMNNGENEVFRFIINYDDSFSCTDYYSKLCEGKGVDLAVFAVKENSDLAGMMSFFGTLLID